MDHRQKYVLHFHKNINNTFVNLKSVIALRLFMFLLLDSFGIRENTF